MDKHPIGDLMETTMQKIREMIDVNTIVGSPIVTADGHTPFQSPSLRFQKGGSDFQTNTSSRVQRRRGSGAGVNIVPVAFLIVKGASVAFEHSPPAASTVDRIIEMVPEVIDKVSEFMSKD